MPTMNDKQAEKIFNQIDKLANRIQSYGDIDIRLLAGSVQNPNCVDEYNAYNQYLIFERQCDRCLFQMDTYMDELKDIKQQIADLYIATQAQMLDDKSGHNLKNYLGDEYAD